MPLPAQQIIQQMVEEDMAARQGRMPHSGLPGAVPGEQPRPGGGVPGGAAAMARGAGGTKPPPATSPWTEMSLNQLPPEAKPSGYEGTGGTILHIANQFLRGASQARQRSFAQQEDQRFKNINAVTNARNDFLANPNYTADAKRAADQAYSAYLAKTMSKDMEGGDKKHPAVQFLNTALEGVTGGKVDKKWDGNPGEFLMQLQEIQMEPKNSEAQRVGGMFDKFNAKKAKGRETFGDFLTQGQLEADPETNALMQQLRIAGVQENSLTNGLMATPKNADELSDYQYDLANWQREKAAAAQAAQQAKQQAALVNTAPPPGAVTQTDEVGQDIIPGVSGEILSGESAGPLPVAAVAPVPAAPAQQAAPPVAAAPVMTAPPPGSPTTAQPTPEYLARIRRDNKAVPQQALYAEGQKPQTGFFYKDRRNEFTGFYNTAGQRLGSEWSIDKPSAPQYIEVLNTDSGMYEHRLRNPDGTAGQVMFQTPKLESTTVSTDDKGKQIVSRVYSNGVTKETPLTALGKTKATEEDNPIEMSPEAIAQAAERFAMTAELPALGGGGHGVRLRTDIINMAAKLYPQVNLAKNKAAYASNRAALVQQQRIQDSIEAFENTALKNLDVFLNTAKKVVDSGSPLLNRPLRAINISALGSTDQAAFRTAREVAVVEIAKVLSNPAGNAALTKDAHESVKALIGPDATLSQIFAAANILKNDMHNRKTSGRAQIKAITDRISGSLSEGVTQQDIPPDPWAKKK